MVDQGKIQRVLRRTSWVVAAGALAYLVARFDLVGLPAGSCSPLLRFSEGSNLLVDRWPGGYAAGDAVFFHGDDQLLYVGLVERTDPEGSTRATSEQLWLVTDNRACPGRASAEFGWVSVDDCAGRILFAWPW